MVTHVARACLNEKSSLKLLPDPELQDVTDLGWITGPTTAFFSDHRLGLVPRPAVPCDFPFSKFLPLSFPSSLLCLYSRGNCMKENSNVKNS